MAAVARASRSLVRRVLSSSAAASPLESSPSSSPLVEVVSIGNKVPVRASRGVTHTRQNQAPVVSPRAAVQGLAARIASPHSVASQVAAASHSTWLDALPCGQQWRSMSSLKPPENVSPEFYVALNALLADDWHSISSETQRIVEKTLRIDSGDVAGKEQLQNAWRAARAVQIFCDRLAELRAALDDVAGSSGDNVQNLPEHIQQALEVANEKFVTYMSSFSEDELWLKRAVELAIGRMFVQIKQRCSHLGPEWGKVSLLATSGLAGSYIERRAALGA